MRNESLVMDTQPKDWRSREIGSKGKTCHKAIGRIIQLKIWSYIQFHSYRAWHPEAS